MGKEEELNLIFVLIMIGLLGIGVFLLFAHNRNPFGLMAYGTAPAAENHMSTDSANRAAGAKGVFAFTAPDTVTEGASALFSWDAARAGHFTSCTGKTEPPGSDGGWTGKKPIKGKQAVGPIEKNTIYFLDCDNKSTNDMKRDVEIVSVLPVHVSINAYPPKITRGGSTLVEWSSTHTNSCTATDSGGAVLGKSTSGSFKTDAVTADTTYTITCQTPKGPKTDSVTVTVTK